MDPNIKARWIKALRSGRYRQGRGTLQDKNGANCCLGVLVRIQGGKRVLDSMNPHKLETSCLNVYPELQKFDPGLPDHGLALAKLNDGVGSKPLSFPEIVTYIEENL